MGDILDPANLQSTPLPDSTSVSSLSAADSLIIPSVDSIPPVQASDIAPTLPTDPVQTTTTSSFPIPPPIEPVPEPLVSGIPTQANAPQTLSNASQDVNSIPPSFPPSSDGGELITPKKKSGLSGARIMVVLLVLLVTMPVGVFYLSKNTLGLFDNRNRAAGNCTQQCKGETGSANASCIKDCNDSLPTKPPTTTTKAPTTKTPAPDPTAYCSADQKVSCQYGCNPTTGGGSCKPSPATTKNPTTNTPTLAPTIVPGATCAGYRCSCSWGMVCNSTKLSETCDTFCGKPGAPPAGNNQPGGVCGAVTCSSTTACDPGTNTCKPVVTLGNCANNTGNCYVKNGIGVVASGTNKGMVCDAAGHWTTCSPGYECSNEDCVPVKKDTPNDTPKLTQPPVLGQCQDIKVYKGTTLLDSAGLAALKPGDVIVYAVKGSNNPTKARFKINGSATWEESATKNASGEYVATAYTIPTDRTSFTVAAEVFVDGAWK